MQFGSRQVSLSALIAQETGWHVNTDVGALQCIDAGILCRQTQRTRLLLKPNGAHFTRFLWPFVTVATKHIFQRSNKDSRLQQQ